MSALARSFVCGLLALALGGVATPAAEVKKVRDADSGQEIIEAVVGGTRIKLAPASGCNLYSIEFAGTELLRQPPKLADLPGFRYGNPILYPTPNRVRDSQFTFNGREYKFTANNGKNFLHGLVHDRPWIVDDIVQKENEVVIRTRLDFKPGTAWHELFPHTHVLKQDFVIRDGSVELRYEVDNSAGKDPIPFGLAYHPWFRYQGERAETFLTIPATHWMQAEELLPTGKLIPLAETKFDARKPKSLAGFVIDDVYFGMRQAGPVLLDFRDRGLQIELASSPEFTHLVVYTPEEPWFCVEPQTCSTDAHNLFARGLKDESHLQIVAPGKKLGGQVVMTFRKR